MLNYISYIWIIVWILTFKYPKVSSHSGEAIDCDPPWEKLHRTCVQFVKTKPFPTWLEARNACISMNSDLLSINDREENTKIIPLLKRHVKSMDTLKWWIGLRQVGSSWKWVDNDEGYAKIPQWGPKAGGIVNPYDNSLHVDRCVYLDFQGYLIDVECTAEQKPYICEQFKITTDSTTSQSTTTSTTTTMTTTTTSKTTATSYPVPTPRPGTPSTRLSVTQSTAKPAEKSTDKPTQKTTKQQNTSFPTDKSTTTTTVIPVTGNSTDETTGKPTDMPTTRLSTSNSTETTTEKLKTGRPIDKSTRKPTDKPITGKPTGKPSTGRPTDARETTTKKPKEEKDEFLGCFAVNHESTCPPVEAFGISWPRGAPGKPVKVPCDKGHAKWHCDKNPTCWRDEPDVSQCTSESIQELTHQMEVFLSDTSNSEKAVEFTENLAASVQSETVMSEQDIFQSTKLMNAASNAKPKNSSEAKNIIKNVAKCGSLLVGKDQKNTWSSMNKESQRTVASSLLTSMESVTNVMLQSFEEPTVEKIVEENMAIELQVIDVNKDGPDGDDAMFQDETNSFAIPQENLKRFSTGGLARLVFINYNTVGELLVPEDGEANDSFERKMISQVISASLNEKPIEEPLIKPVVFTMKTEDRAKNQEWKQLCSFWNFSLGYTGAWSQKGCSLKKYNESHTTCQCNHLTNFAILMDIHSTKLMPIHATTLSYITYVGIIISIICLFLSWITFICLSLRCMRGSRGSHGNGEANEYYGTSGSYSGSAAGSRSAQGERNSIHKNLVFCLFIAEVLFLAGIERTDNKIACSIIAGFLHYFFLSSFTWMFVEGIHILFMLVQVFDAAKSRLRYYYIIGYGVPLITVGVSALIYYDGYGTERYCWLTTDRMFIWSFAGPVAFILLVNLIVLMYAMSAVCKHSEYVFTKEKTSVGNIKLLALPAFAQQTQQRMRKHQAWVQGALALEVLLGLTWVFGYFYISEEAIPMAYLFTIFNSLQGLFIFVFHCILNKKVRKEYGRFIDYPRRPVSSGTHSSKGSHHSGSGPNTSSYHMNGTRKHSGGFVSLGKDRRSSSRSTTSA
ncbi:adhesion G protein-coupled receptor L4-like isoform X2 [Mercenaria mercenaria]|uniref:adhesion G protein-coupled receptor L4-like isoform X2 n=1 Tax=Mercenaria mercenaria TaxID=6596 RepID=UPI00234E75D3|nr:adhesion G protein-coupled receptor L4-like isoform X2 [Mercenaria mercenaria]